MKKQKILIYGGSGQIGSKAFELLSRQFEVIAPLHQEVDVTDRKQIRENINQVNPSHILYCVGFTYIDKAPQQIGDSFMLNTGAVHYITEHARKKSLPFFYLSTEVVFDGTKEDAPYTEADQPNPLSINGMTKRLGELVTLDASSKNSVIRLIVCYSAMYKGKTDLARLALSKLMTGQAFTATNDQEINPIYIDHLIAALATILKNRAAGIYHLGATDYTTPYDFTKRLVRKLKLDESKIIPITFAEFSKTRPEPRPQHEWLNVSKFQKDFGRGILHTVDEGIEAFIKVYPK